MSGVERDKIKSLIELRESSAKAKILILGFAKASSIIIRNLFDKNFNEDDLIDVVSGIKVLNIEKDVSISYSKAINGSDNEIDYSNFEGIIYGLSLLNKRINIEEIEKISKLKEKNEKLILVLTDIEMLDLRELREMKDIINSRLEGIDILTVMDLEIESIYNQWDGVVTSIRENLDDNKKISFMKSQIIDNSFKNDICDEIVNFYINIFDDVESETLSEADLIYIQTNMVSEILALYPHSDEVSKAIISLVEENITELIRIKREKIAAILKAEEEARLAEEARLKAEEEARLAEEARIKAEEEARLAEEKRIREEEEARLKAEEEARLAEEARIKAEEEARIAEEKRIREEEEARIKAEEEARLAEEARIKAEEEARLAEEKRIREEEEARLKAEEERLRKEEEARLKAEEEARKEEERRRKAEAEAKERAERRRKQKLELLELKKLEDERKVLNERIRELNKSLRKNYVTDSNSDIDDMIIEASFTVDDSVEGEVEPKHAVNEIEARIDGIIYEAIASKMEELVEEVREEIKEKLKDNSII